LSVGFAPRTCGPGDRVMACRFGWPSFLLPLLPVSGLAAQQRRL
jgi:hypothetical protein